MFTKIKYTDAKGKVSERMIFPVTFSEDGEKLFALDIDILESQLTDEHFDMLTCALKEEEAIYEDTLEAYPDNKEELTKDFIGNIKSAHDFYNKGKAAYRYFFLDKIEYV